VGVLISYSDERAGISWEMIVREFSLRSWAQWYHFTGSGEMVLWLLFAVFAGFDSSFYGSLESLPLLISEKFLELTSRPILLIVFVGMADRVKKWERHIS
jgi:hypothetical protein